MARLRVIAVENVNVTTSDSVEPAIACVFKDRLLHVYDTFGELYHQKEYFGSFESLEYLIKKGKYEWTDFYIEKGQLITRDIHNNIVVEGQIIDPFLPLEEGNNGISDVTLKIYYEFLKTLNKNDANALETLKGSFESGEFRREIEQMIAASPFKEFNDVDKQLIVRIKIDGYQYIVDRIKDTLKKGDYYRFDEINYMFSRIFKLEKNNYIVL
jgi:hypothetical protein